MGLWRRAESSREALAVADSVVVVLELAAVDEVLVSFGLAAAAALAVGGGGGFAEGVMRSCQRSYCSSACHSMARWRKR